MCNTVGEKGQLRGYNYSSNHENSSYRTKAQNARLHHPHKDKMYAAANHFATSQDDDCILASSDVDPKMCCELLGCKLICVVDVELRHRSMK